MPYQRTRTDRALNCGQAWTKRLWSTFSRRPTKSWQSRGTCFTQWHGSLHWDDILIQKSPVSLITADHSFINDKHALNYVFSELKCSFQAMRKWRMVFLHGDWCYWTEANPSWMHSCAFLFIYVSSSSAHSVRLQLYSSYVEFLCGSVAVRNVFVFQVFRSALEPGEERKEQWYAPARPGMWRKINLQI